MKKITLLLMLCMSVGIVKAAVVLDEIFNYSVANLGLEGTWTTSGTLTTGTGRTFEGTGMTYTNAGGTYILSGLGKTLNNNYQAGTNYISYKSFPAITSGTVYLSFLYKANGDQGQSASEIMGLADQATNSAVKPWAGKQADQTKNPFRIGITRASTTGSDIQYVTNQTLSTGTVYLIVVKYEFLTPASSSKASIFINPTLATTTEPTADAFDNSLGTVRASLSKLMFKHNGSSVANFYVSGARISTTWAEAVAAVSLAPKLPAPVVGTASLVGSEGFTANWTPVENAIGYDINVYQGATQFATYSASGQASSSLAISGLLTNTTYTYKIVAKGNGTDYNNSDESISSDNFQTLEGLVSINTDFSDGSWGTPFAPPSTNPLIPASGSFPTSSANGFDIVKGYLYGNTSKGPKGEMHTNSIVLDKNSYTSMLVFPTVKTVEQIEIHAYSGSDAKSFLLKELVGSIWTTVGTYNTTNAEGIYIIPVSRTVPSKFRIENNTTSGLFITQVITRTSNPTLLTAPAIGTASNITSTGFTANWTPAAANATGYNVFVYSGTTLVNVYPASGQATNTVAITDLASNTAYTFKVTAKGDGDINYSDSYLSAVSAGLTTLLSTPVVQPASVINPTGFTANWSDVPGAQAYDVYLYDNTSAQIDNINVIAPSTSCSFSNLTEGITYTYKVIARGDGSTTFDSAISESMTATPGTATGINSTITNSFVTATGKTILCSEAGQIQVYNLQGAKVLEVPNAYKANTTLESGLYIVRFTGKDGQIKSTKVIIK